MAFRRGHDFSALTRREAEGLLAPSGVFASRATVSTTGIMGTTTSPTGERNGTG